MISIRTLALAVVVSLIVGIGAGFVLGGGIDDHPRAANPTATHVQEATRIEQQRSRSARNQDDLRPIEARDDPGTTSASPDSRRIPPVPLRSEVSLAEPYLDRLRSIVDSLPTPREQQGEGVITGLVTEAETGLPLSGILVEALENDRGSGGWHHRIDRSEDAETLESKVRKSLESFEFSLKDTIRRHSLSFSARTDSTGRYEITGLRDATYLVRPRSYRYSFQSIRDDGELSVRWTNAKPGEVANWIATRQWIVAVSVQMPDGSMGANIAVGADPRDEVGSRLYSSSHHTTTSSTGEPAELDLTAGEYFVVAKPPNDAPFLVSESVPTTVGEGGVQSVVVKLLAVPGVEVTMVKSHDDGIRDELSIYCIETAETEPPTMHELRQSDRAGLHVQVKHWNEENARPLSFRFNTAAPRLLVAVRQDSIIASLPLPAASEPIRIQMPFPARPRESYVVVRALDPTGQMLKQGVRVESSLKVRNASAGSLDSWKWKRRRDGSWWAPHLAPVTGHIERSDLTWTVTVSHADYGTTSVQYVPGPESELVIQFQEPASVEFLVDGLPQHTIAEHFVVAVQLPEERRPRVASLPSTLDLAPTASPGVVMKGFQPGQVHCGLMIPAGSSNHFPLIGREVRLEPGVNTVRISVPALYPVTVRVALAGAEGDVSIWPKKDVLGIDGKPVRTYQAALQRPLSRNRDAEFPPLPAGNYLARYISDSQRRIIDVEFTLPGNSIVVVGE